MADDAPGLWAIRLENGQWWGHLAAADMPRQFVSKDAANAAIRQWRNEMGKDTLASARVVRAHLTEIEP